MVSSGVCQVRRKLFLLQIIFKQDRRHMKSKRLINLSWILDLGNYLQSLQRWLEIYQKHQANPIEEQRFYNIYIKIVKPVIHKYHKITTSIDQSTYGFYSDKLQSQQIQALKDVFKDLNRFDILNANELKSIHHDQMYELVTDQTFKSKNSDDVGLLNKPVTNLTSVPLNQKPKNEEYPYWGTYLKVDEVGIESRVIHGKGVAKKQLGFPTANLLVDETAELALKQHPNGVYLVQFTFKNGPRYLGVCCIGTNPHYENLKHKRLIQVYIYHEFEQDFYDAEVSMKLIALIRFQGKFQTFDSFLNAMHNDIEMGKEIAKKLNIT